MPLEQRVIKPILISRSSLPLDSQGNPISIPNELECVTNGTLANIIRQLSSLSKYAEDLFAGILHEATLLIARSTSLQGRIDRLAVRVTQLDSSVEEVSLKEIQLRKPFRSCASYDQQVVARTTMPESIKEIYMSCDRPPPLEKLNAYRDDGKDGLKFYTDPNYFFELWSREMLEATEREKSGKKNAHRGPNKGQGDLGPNERRRGKPRQPQNTARDIMAKIPATEFIDSTRLQQQQNLHQQQIYQQPNGSMQGVGHYGQPQHYSQTLERPRSLGINQYQIDGFHNMDPMTIPQAIPNHPPPAYYPPGSIMNQNPYHTGNQGAINEITSTGSHTPPPSYFATPGSGTGDSMISINQMTGGQLNQGQPTRRINSQDSSSASITSRPSQPPPSPPSNPPAGQSLTRESLPPPPPPSSGMNSVVRGDSLDSELPLPPPSGTPVDEDAPVNEHGQPSKRIRLTPEDLLNRNSITIFHLIHGSISRTKKKPKEKKTTDSDAGSKDPENDETPNIENNDSVMVIGPRVKVGPDGQIIIDEESLVIKKTKPVETTSVEESVSGKTTYASFRKRPPTARWSKTETIEFYTALNLIGPDFSLMSTLFFNGKRTRTDLKNKFRRENKLNQPVIEKALYEADVDYCLARVAS